MNMNRGLWIAAAILFFFGPTADAAPAAELSSTTAIQHNGRVKPFDSFAREVLWQVTGEFQWKGQDPAATVRSMMNDPSAWKERLLLSVPFVPLREALGLDRKTDRISYARLVSERKLMRMLPAIVEKQSRSEKLSMLDQETMDLYGRFVALSDLFEGHLTVIAPSSADCPARWRLKLEVGYNRLAPFRIARWIYLAAGLLLAFGVWSRPAFGRAGMGVFAGAFAIHAVGILTRVVLAGRPPVANFYETMLWLPFVAATLALIFERVYRVGYFGLSAAFLAFIMLALADRLPLDPSLTPIVAVLRSNLWLTIHVLTIVASYGALSLAAVLAHLYGIFVLTGSRSGRLPMLDTFLYRCLQVGVVLLTAGIMLGGVWANASWGRYWGWDPKETWALITLLWFLAVLHGRFAGWLKGVRVALATLAGYFLLLMTYYGVSFYLVGLHSYAGGHAKPIPPLLIAYLAAELLFILGVACRAWYTELRKDSS